MACHQFTAICDSVQSACKLAKLPTFLVCRSLSWALVPEGFDEARAPLSSGKRFAGSRAGAKPSWSIFPHRSGALSASPNAERL
jgi:hypothetical protein